MVVAPPISGSTLGHPSVTGQKVLGRRESLGSWNRQLEGSAGFVEDKVKAGSAGFVEDKVKAGKRSGLRRKAEMALVIRTCWLATILVKSKRLVLVSTLLLAAS